MTDVKQYLIDGIKSFDGDPADSPFQRGYQSALRVVLTECFYLKGEEEPRIKTGSVVRLKSGGPDMTVCRTYQNEDRPAFYAQWFDYSGNLNTTDFRDETVDVTFPITPAERRELMRPMTAEEWSIAHTGHAGDAGRFGTVGQSPDDVGTSGTCPNSTDWRGIGMAISFALVVIGLAVIVGHR